MTAQNASTVFSDLPFWNITPTEFMDENLLQKPLLWRNHQNQSANVPCAMSHLEKASTCKITFNQCIKAISLILMNLSTKVINSSNVKHVKIGLSPTIALTFISKGTMKKQRNLVSCAISNSKILLDFRNTRKDYT